MGTTADKLTYLTGTKTALRAAINSKGGHVEDATTFRNYAAELNDANQFEDPAWGNLRKLLREDTGITGMIYKTAVLELINANSGSTTYALSASSMVGVKNHLGETYTFATDGASVTHTWDTAQDLTDSHGVKYRWAIRYYNAALNRVAFSYNVDSLWLLFSAGFIHNGFTRVVYNHLIGIDALDNVLVFLGTCTNFFMGDATQDQCGALQFVCPIDFSGANSVSNVLYYQRLHELTIIPKTTAFYYQSTPQNMCNHLKVGGSGTMKFSSTSYLYGAALQTVDGILDFTSCTTSNFVYLFGLIHMNMIAPNLSFNISSATNLDFESLTFLCDNAPAVTAKTITLGATLIARAGAANITKLTTKGWTVA